MLEYLQQLQDKVLEEETALLEGAKGSKCKKVTAGDEEEQRPSKKAKKRQQEKYCGGITAKIGDANLYEKYISTVQNCLVHHSRWVVIIIIIITFSNNFFFIADFSHMLGILLSSSSMYSILTPTLWP